MNFLAYLAVGLGVAGLAICWQERGAQLRSRWAICAVALIWPVHLVGAAIVAIATLVAPQFMDQVVREMRRRLP